MPTLAVIHYRPGTEVQTEGEGSRSERSSGLSGERRTALRHGGSGRRQRQKGRWAGTMAKILQEGMGCHAVHRPWWRSDGWPSAAPPSLCQSVPSCDELRASPRPWLPQQMQLVILCRQGVTDGLRQ